MRPFAALHVGFMFVTLIRANLLISSSVLIMGIQWDLSNPDKLRIE